MSGQKLTQRAQEELNQQLFDAICFDDLSAVKAAVEAGADVNKSDKYGYSLLSFSVKKTGTAVTEYLLKAGADPNIQNQDPESYKQTVLHIAALYGYTDHVKLLLKYGADMHIKDKLGNTPCIYSIAYYHTDISELFALHGYVLSQEDSIRIENERLFKAIKENDLPGVRRAVESGADVNAKDEWNLHALQNSMWEDIKITQYLLETGADPNMRDDDGCSVLHQAARYGYLNKIKLFLKYKADMYIENDEGDTPFAAALMFREYDAAELLVLNEYVPSKKDFENIEDEAEKEKITERLMTLAAQVQERKERLAGETETAQQKFAYADEVIEM